MFYRHGMHKHPLYRVWAAMRDRCTNKNNPQLDRIDNCRFVPARKNLENRRTTKWVDTAEWGRISIADASERTGIPHNTLVWRIQKGWDVERALSGPATLYPRESL